MGQTVRFGLIGTGRITDWVLQGAREDTRFEARAICSRSMEKARAFAASHAIPVAYDDLDRMLASDDIDAVYIGTPNHTHAALAIRCLKAGKHVLCEKPFASNALEAGEMVAAARERGLVVMEAMISCLNPNFRKAASLLDRIGPIRRYSATFCQYSSKYEALKRGEVAASFDPAAAGGALMDIGIYTIWPMVHLFGAPYAVRPNLVLHDIPGRGPIDLQGTVDFTYPGFNATVFYSKVADSFLPTEISGEGGNLLLDQIHISRKLTFIPHGAPASGRGKAPAGEDLTVREQHDEYFYEFREFIDCVLEGRESRINTPETSLEVMRILDSVRTQAGISTNPGKTFGS